MKLRLKILILGTLLLSSFVVKSQCVNNFNLGNDTSFCDVTSSILDAGNNYVDYLWSTGQTTQTIAVNSTGAYWCTVHSLSNLNLVLNGDFESGNTQFTSDYVVGTGGTWGQLSSPGTYAVTTNPSSVHNNFPPCVDHTSGTGYMMVVNGANTPNTAVWKQTIAVNPNTDYDFSAWFTSVISNNPASLTFTINGNTIGSNVNLSSTTCFWQNFSASWNSGTSTSATIAITNQITSGSGNDFAIDDIYFSEVCEFSDTINLVFGNTPVFDLGNDTTICNGDSLILSPNVNPADYLWSNGSVDDSIIVTNTGLYSVTISSNNCSASDSIEVTVNDNPVVDLGNDTILCDHNSITLDASNQNATYLWNDLSQNSSITTDTAGLYWVKVSIGPCSTTDSINIDAQLSPIVDLGPDLDLCNGEEYTINAGKQNAYYLWNTGDTDSAIVVNTTGNYWVELSNYCGTKTDSINIVFDKCDCEVYIPTAYTPNNDGLNDVFMPIYNCKILDFELLIYNRYGELIYTSENHQQGWDGTYNGTKAPQGVYAWILKYEALIQNAPKEFQKTGTVTLIR